MEEQIKELHIENYKGIESLKLDNLSRVNILIGANNTKKTTVLEAIYIAKSYYNAFSGIYAANTRDLIIRSDELSTMFYNLDTNKKINIKTVTKEKLDKYEVSYFDYKEFISQNNSYSNSELGFQTLKNNEKIYSANIQIDLNGKLDIQDELEKEKLNLVDYVSSRSKKDFLIIEKLRKVKLAKKIKKLIEILNKMDSRVLDLQEVNEVVYIDIEGIPKLIPLKLVGDGLYNLLDIALTITLENKIVLIDEIENGMHYYALKELLKELLKQADQYQLFITTHSMDTLNAIRDILKFNTPDLDISFINLKNRDERLELKVYDKNNFLEKMSRGWDIR